jgi:hypothetical protein
VFGVSTTRGCHQTLPSKSLRWVCCYYGTIIQHEEMRGHWKTTKTAIFSAIIKGILQTLYVWTSRYLLTNCSRPRSCLKPSPLPFSLSFHILNFPGSPFQSNIYHILCVAKRDNRLRPKLVGVSATQLSECWYAIAVHSSLNLPIPFQSLTLSPLNIRR